MQPYLESLLSYIDGAPPWNYVPTTEARPWKSHLETPRNYALTQINHIHTAKEYSPCIDIH